MVGSSDCPSHPPFSWHLTASFRLDALTDLRIPQAPQAPLILANGDESVIHLCHGPRFTFILGGRGS